jgi:hypothetical protein
VAAASCTESYSSQKRGNFFEALGDKLSYEGITDKDALPSVFYQGMIKAQTCDQSDGVRANETGRGSSRVSRQAHRAHPHRGGRDGREEERQIYEDGRSHQRR